MQLYSKRYAKRLLVILIVILSLKSSFSQSFSPNSSFISYWQIQADVGTSLFFGDVKQYQWWPVSDYENEWRLGFGLQLNKQISPVFGIRGQVLYGQLAGTKRDWNKHFTNDYFEFNLNTTINISNLLGSYRNDRFFNAYVIIGIGLQQFNTDIYELGSNKLLQQVGAGNGRGIGGRTLEGIFIGGLGFDFRLTDRLSLNLETANRVMNSDMLDGTVGGANNDVYNLSTIGLSYKFAYSKKRAKKQESEEPQQTQRRSVDVETTEYDYGQQPIQPPTEAIFISSNIVTEPLKEKEIVEEVIVEPEAIVIIEEVEPIVRDFEYRVQIRAKLGNPISLNHLSNTYNIPTNEIKQNTFNGYYIYTVGSFATYEEARTKRNQLRSYNGATDSFVVAFRNGNRMAKLP